MSHRESRDAAKRGGTVVQLGLLCAVRLSQVICRLAMSKQPVVERINAGAKAHVEGSWAKEDDAQCFFFIQQWMFAALLASLK